MSSEGNPSLIGENLGLCGSNNLLQMLHQTVLQHASKPALYNPNETGEYDVWTYERLWRDIRVTANHLAQEGICAGDMVGLLAEGRAWWPICDLAILSLGACTVPVYPSLPADQIVFIIQNSGMKGIIVQDKKQLDKILSIPRSEIANLEFIVLLEESSEKPADYRLHSFPGWLKGLTSWSEDVWKGHFEPLHRDTLATIVYTSGTTGTPKGVMLTHGNLLANVEGIIEMFPVKPEDRSLSYLPLSHIFERTAGQFVMLKMGASVVYSRGFAYLQEDLVKMPPTLLTTVPRFLEKVYEGIHQKLRHGSALKRRLFERAVAEGMAVRVRKEKRYSLALAIYDSIVLKPIHQALGGRLGSVISGGAPLPRYVGDFFTAVGLKVAEGYGMTETSPVICVNPVEDIRLGTAGKVLSNVEVRIADDGEVLAKGPSITQGYFKNDAATTELFTEDGWLKTGDIGELSPDGYLRITDRKKNLIVLSTGKKVMPSPIEEDILQSPYIEQILLVGQGYKFISAIVVPNESAVINYMERHHKKKVPVEAWMGDPVVQELLLREVRNFSDGYAEFERPKKILVVSEPFSVENGCLTPTLKIKARVVITRFADEIEALYATISSDVG